MIIGWSAFGIATFFQTRTIPTAVVPVKPKGNPKKIPRKSRKSQTLNFPEFTQMLVYATGADESTPTPPVAV